MAEKVITVKQINEKIKSIEKILKEDHPVVASEKAHVEQDKLVQQVLESIATGAEDAAGLAKAASKVYNLEFTRWYK